MSMLEVLEQLEYMGTKRVAQGMARYGIVTSLRTYGVSMSQMQALAKELKKEHDSPTLHTLAAELWDSGVYEAQMLATLVDDPALLTKKQMNAWAADFDNWAIVDTACFCLFDRSPLAWERAVEWAKSDREFVKRAGYALMACLAGHDKEATEKQFIDLLPLIESGARDERNFVKKGVSWALRRIGRRTPALRDASLEVIDRLVASKEAPCRWVGNDAKRDLAKAWAGKKKATKRKAAKKKAGRAG